jgi:hypothetical protein
MEGPFARTSAGFVKITSSTLGKASRPVTAAVPGCPARSAMIDCPNTPPKNVYQSIAKENANPLP